MGVEPFLPQINEYFKTNIGIETKKWKAPRHTQGRNFRGLDPYLMVALGLSFPQKYQ